MDGLFNLFANIIVFGLLLWAVDALLPLPRGIKHLLKLVVMIVLIIFILQFFGVIHTILPMLAILR